MRHRQRSPAPPVLLVRLTTAAPSLLQSPGPRAPPDGNDESHTRRFATPAASHCLETDVRSMTPFLPAWPEALRPDTVGSEGGGCSEPSRSGREARRRASQLGSSP